MKKHRALVLLGWALLCPLATLSGQQAMELQVIGSAGTVPASSDGSTLHFTVGELAVAEVANANNLLAQGFHQVLVGPSVPVAEPANTHFNLRVYPNPSADFLQIETDLPVQVSLFDLYGRLVVPARAVTHAAVFEVGELTAGIYLLRVADPERPIFQTFTIFLNP